MIGKKIEKNEMARINAENIVKMPLVADLYVSYLAKYRGVRYAPSDIYLKQALARLPKVCFWTVVTD